jgi:hypothetical protein
MKGVLSCLALGASLLLAASPALAADTYHYRNSGTGLSASFSNFPWDQEQIPPGTYFETYVDASSSIRGTDGATSDICVSSWTFTIDADGNWTDEDGFGYCGQASLLTLDKKLASGHVVATFPIEECLDWGTGRLLPVHLSRQWHQPHGDRQRLGEARRRVAHRRRDHDGRLSLGVQVG